MKNIVSNLIKNGCKSSKFCALGLNEAKVPKKLK